MEQEARLEGELIRSGIPDSGDSPSPLSAGEPADVRYLDSDAKPRTWVWPVPEAQPDCTPKFVVKVCGCKAVKVASSCNRLSCQRCQNHLRARRARAIADRLQPHVDGGKAVVYLILTTPEHRREAMADPKVWSTCLRKLWKHLEREHGALFGVQRSDPAGDEEPLKWAIHANILFVKRDGFRDWTDVEKIKGAWAEIVGAEKDLLGKPIIDVRIAYAGADDQSRVNHWYDYQGRTWAAWRKAVPKHLTVKWYGNRKHYKRKKLPAWCCSECGERYRAIRCKWETEADEYVFLGPRRALAVAYARGKTDFDPEAT